MKTLILTIASLIVYAIVFFILSLRNTRNIKDAFYEWSNTLKEWKNHAVVGIVFLLILLILGLSIGT